MEGLCKFCLNSRELSEVPGFNEVACSKCSEQLTGDSIGFYISLAAAFCTLGSATTSTDVVVMDGEADNVDDAASNKIILSLDQHQQQQQQKQVQLQSNDGNIQEGEVNLLSNAEGSYPLCNRTFSRESSLLAHMPNHSRERKFACARCNKIFTQAANLKRHERIHTDGLAYVCGDCGKKFRQVTLLNNHRRLHTKDRPFVCTETGCGRSFAQVISLNNHMRVHHKTQLYACDQCVKTFTKVSALNQHLQTHKAIIEYY